MDQGILTFYVKKIKEEILKYIEKTVEVTFWLIPISQSVLEI